MTRDREPRMCVTHCCLWGEPSVLMCAFEENGLGSWLDEYNKRDGKNHVPSEKWKMRCHDNGGKAVNLKEIYTMDKFPLGNFSAFQKRWDNRMHTDRLTQPPPKPCDSLQPLPRTCQKWIYDFVKPFEGGNSLPVKWLLVIEEVINQNWPGFVIIY